MGRIGLGTSWAVARFVGARPRALVTTGWRRTLRDRRIAVRSWVHRHPWLAALPIVAVYAAIVSYWSAQHEPWRDEVVPMTLVQETSSMSELWRRVRHEGHPILWYACLRYAWLALGSTAALKVVSVLVAVGAMTIFLVSAPLPLRLKILFTFSWLPLYEYSVMARNYGLGMLCLFAFCALYPRRRDHPMAVALTLALLANSNLLGFILTVSAGVMLAVDDLTERPRRAPWPAAAIAVYVVGLALCVWTYLGISGETGAAVQLDLRSFVSGVVGAVFTPGRQAWVWMGLLPSLWFWLYLLTLLPRPALLCFAGISIIGFALLFELVFPPNHARRGYLLLAVIATMWMDASRSQDTWAPWSDAVGRWIHRLRCFLVIPLVFTLVVHLFIGLHHGVEDAKNDHSSSRRLGLLIASDPRLDRAIVIAEPEPSVQSLPYYRDNPTYLQREGVFGRTIGFEKSRRKDMSLSELLQLARDLRDRHGSPVVIALGWQLDGPPEQAIAKGTNFEETFTTTPAAIAEFRRRTQQLGSFRAATLSDENYDVFVLW